MVTVAGARLLVEAIRRELRSRTCGRCHVGVGEPCVTSSGQLASDSHACRYDAMHEALRESVARAIRSVL